MDFTGYISTYFYSIELGGNEDTRIMFYALISKGKVASCKYERKA
jgi:hypothetical protein